MQLYYRLLPIVALSLVAAHRYEVHTSVGKAIGFVDPAVPDVKQWVGIPFAEPPTGSRRFLAPVAKAKEKRQRIDASKPPPSCPQYQSALPSIFNNATPEFLAPPPYVEDCLYLNVFVPRLPKQSPLPVIVWFHGGNLVVGGINTPYERPQKWVQRSQEHIVVQFK